MGIIKHMMRKVIYMVSQLLRRIGVSFDAKKNPAVAAMHKRINDLGAIDLSIDIHPDGTWSAESTNLDGIITGGSDATEIDATIKDAIFTYFKIPPYLADDTLLQAPNEPVTIQQRIWATQ